MMPPKSVNLIIVTQTTQNKIVKKKSLLSFRKCTVKDDKTERQNNQLKALGRGRGEGGEVTFREECA